MAGATQGRFPNDALLLIAHGSERYPDAGRTALALADTLRARGHFAQIAVGFLNGRPSVADALASLARWPIHVVPFFMEDGYFVRVAVPNALAGTPDLRIYPPVGTHPGMVDVIRARIGDREGADIVLIGHGSAKSPGRRLALHDHARRLGARVAFLEEPPSLADVLRDATGPSIVAIGVFAGEGGHVRDDVPASIAAARAQYGDRPIYLGSIGGDAGMAELVLNRVAGV